jgi:hypothetical protein
LRSWLRVCSHSSCPPMALNPLAFPRVSLEILLLRPVPASLHRHPPPQFWDVVMNGGSISGRFDEAFRG